MSSKKRRIKRKVAMLLRMDATRARMPPASFIEVWFNVPQKEYDYWERCIRPLGDRLLRYGPAGTRAHQAFIDQSDARVARGGRA